VGSLCRVGVARRVDEVCECMKALLIRLTGLSENQQQKGIRVIEHIFCMIEHIFSMIATNLVIEINFICQFPIIKRQ